MNTLIRVFPESILALSVVAAKRDLREYINSIFVEITPKHGVLLGATDGYRMLIHEAPCDVQQDVELTAIIPIGMFSGVKKSGADVFIEIGPQEEGTKSRNVTVTQGQMSVTGRTMNYDLLNWRNAIKPFKGGGPRQFNPDYVTDWAKVYRLLHKKVDIPRVYIYHNGRDQAVVDLGREDFFAIMMPLANCPQPDPGKLLPNWVKA